MGTDTALGVVGSTAAGSIWAVGASGEVHVRPDTCAGDQGLGVRYLGTMFERWNGRAWDIDPTGQTILAGLGPTIELPHASIALVGQTGWFVASDPWRTAVAQLRGGRWYAAEHPRDSVRRT
jgi:hypothetical protein